MLASDFIDTNVIGLTKGTSLQHIKLLILRAIGSDACMPLLISDAEFTDIASYLSGKEEIQTEVLQRLAKAFHIQLEYIEIHKEERGEHRVFLFYSLAEEMRRLEVDLPFAVSLSVKEKKPIRIHKELFLKHAKENANEGKIAFALIDMTDELLQEAEQAAVEEENYELATLIRDEIRRRSITKIDE